MRVSSASAAMARSRLRPVAAHTAARSASGSRSIPNMRTITCWSSPSRPSMAATVGEASQNAIDGELTVHPIPVPPGGFQRRRRLVRHRQPAGDQDDRQRRPGAPVVHSRGRGVVRLFSVRPENFRAPVCRCRGRPGGKLMTLTTPVTDDHSTPPRLVTTTTPASAGSSGSTWFSATASSTRMTGRRPFNSARYRTRRSTRVAGISCSATPRARSRSISAS